MENNRDIFIAKLDRFIRKYYQNLLLRGVLLCLVLFLSYFFLISFSEYNLYLSVKVRTILVIFSIIFILFLGYQFLIRPIVGLLKIGQRISYRQAIQIISEHFPELQDKLINTLELTEQASELKDKENSLLLASINQRIDSVKLVPFRRAVSFKTNYKYLKYLVAVFGLLILVHFLIPDMYSNSTERLVNFNTKYAPPADFSFHLDDWSGRAVKGSDFSLKVHTEGKYIPKEVYLITDNSRFLLKKEKSGKFSYLFRNINSNISFRLQSGKVISENFQIKVISKPGIKNFSISIKSPPYTKLPLQVEKNIGDVSVPAGSDLEWKFETELSSAGELIFSDSLNPTPVILEGNVLKFSRKISEKNSYRVFLTNDEFDRESYAQYHIDVIPDLYPQIKIASIQDSIIESGYYFRGQIKDDYGFSKLRFVYQAENLSPTYIPISVNQNLSSQEFFFSFDFSSENFQEGSNVKYHFEVFDNDAINGAKKASSQQFNYYIPDSKQLYDLNAAVQDSIGSKISKGIQLSESIQEDILRMQKNALDGSAEKWQQEQLLNQIGDKKKQLDELLQEVMQENQRKNRLMNSSGMDDPVLMDKQKQIEELLEKVMDPELQKLFEEFNKLADDMKSEDINKLGNQLKMSMNDFQKQLDRNLQLLERYEIEVRVQQLSDRIQKLADEQENAADNKRRDSEKLKEIQQSGKEKWDELTQDLKDVLDQNSAIQKPYDFDEDISDQQKEINDLIKESTDLIQNSKTGKGAKNMKKTSAKQRKLAQKLNDNISNSTAAQITEDIGNLIRLMNNLIEFSFQQEDVLNAFKRIGYLNPIYAEMIEEQGELKEEYKLIQDSLLALSSRSPQVASLVGNRIFNIENELENVITEASERRKVQAATGQQKVLTDVNELSVFLSEALNQMMEQMANAMPGDQLGDKKNGQASFPGLKSQQQSLKKMLEELISDMKNGNVENGSKEKLGKFLQRQEMYRQNLNEMLQKGGLGNESEKILREVTKMLDQMESDISNFSINSSMIFRQNRIFSKLLEAENAHREKDFDKKRESKSGNIIKLSNPREIFEYKRVRSDFEGVFYDSNVKMFDYYNKLYLDYMIKLNND
ncbi:DUF4175 family protein [Marinifilum caeruleilacunae]|uniref:DUF4175 family protein n=1 Tax=Marinifilum caeruleilacunae TaxID=2499076 RepID=A0ABX1WUQ6_9BACT|nr:DUF4175 family protein [Marinifilum caeruleilacunae]NOU59820.1 hypothetical protein [Marinifilum caeruleilacunae]